MAVEGGGSSSGGSSFKKWALRFFALGIVGAIVAVSLILTGKHDDASHSEPTTTSSRSSKPAPVQPAPVIPPQNVPTTPSTTIQQPIEEASSMLSPETGSGNIVFQNPSIKENLLGGNNVISNAGSNALSNLDSGSSMATSSEGGCSAANGDELINAVESGCSNVVLTNFNWDTPYVLSKEIVVNRQLTVTGQPLNLPAIQPAFGVPRCFRVVPGGLLNVNFVTLKPGFAIRPRLLAGIPGEVVEVRGGSVYFEAGAVGGLFNGVVFNNANITQEAARTAIQYRNMNMVTRVIGGHVFMAGGIVDFNACIFNDIQVLTGLATISLIVGGDILVAAGVAAFLGCTFAYTTPVAVLNVVGLQVAVFAGAAVFTASNILIQCVFCMMNGAGLSVFVGTGAVVQTATTWTMWEAGLIWTGIGYFFVGAGALVFTGSTFTTFNALMIAWGAGFYHAVGTGANVQTAMLNTMFNGPTHRAGVGGQMFLGTGSITQHAVATSNYVANCGFKGQGLINFNAVGDLVGIASPFWSFYGLSLFFGTGGVYNLDVGATVYIASPVYVAKGLELFLGLGRIVFVGVGVIVSVASPYKSDCGLCTQADDYYVASGTTAGGTARQLDYEDGEGYLPEVDPELQYEMDDKSVSVATIIDASQFHDVPGLATYSSMASSGYLTGESSAVYVAANEALGAASNSLIAGNDTWRPALWLSEAKQAELNGETSDNNAYIGPVAACSVCGVFGNEGQGLNLKGPGASTCNVASECSAANPEATPPIQVLGIDVNKVVSPVLNVVIAQATATCAEAAGADCVSAKQIKDAFKAVMPAAFRVAVAKDTVDPLVADDVGRRLQTDGTLLGTDGTVLSAGLFDEDGSRLIQTSFKVHLISLDFEDSVVKDALAMLMDSDGLDVINDGVLSHIEENGLSAADGGLRDLGLTLIRNIDVPQLAEGAASLISGAPTRKLKTKPEAVTFSAFGPSVEVYSADNILIPLGSLNPGVVGQECKIVLRNYDHGRRLKVEIMGSLPVLDATVPTIRGMSRMIKSLHTYDANQEENIISWVPGSRLDGIGNYYIKITDVDSGKAQASPVFTVNREGRRQLEAHEAMHRSLHTTSYTA